MGGLGPGPLGKSHKGWVLGRGPTWALRHTTRPLPCREWRCWAELCDWGPVLQPCRCVQVVPYFPQGRALYMGQNNHSLPAEAGARNQPEPRPVVLSRSLLCPGVNHLRPVTPTTQAQLWWTSTPAWSCSVCPSVLHIRRCATLPSSPVIPEPQEPRWQGWLGHLLRLPLHLVPPCWGAAVSWGDQHPQAAVGAQTPVSAHGFCPGRLGVGLEAGQLYRLWTSLALSGRSAAHCSRTAWTSGWEPCPGARSPRWRPSSGLRAEGRVPTSKCSCMSGPLAIQGALCPLQGRRSPLGWQPPLSTAAHSPCRAAQAQVHLTPRPLQLSFCRWPWAAL